jgi:hypothetical protein
MVDLAGIKKTFDKYYSHTGKLSVDPNTGLISCTGSVKSKEKSYLDGKPGIKTLRVRFGKIRYDFAVQHTDLVSLEGAPSWVGRDFKCGHNQLTSLLGSPQHVGGDFKCDNNNIESLEHCPKSVGANFSCMTNQLSSLEHVPEKVHDLFCMENKLVSLHGAPKTITGELRAWGNQLESLEGMPTEVRVLWIDYSPTLPLLRCLNAKKLWSGMGWPHEVRAILQKYMGQGKRAMFDCQKELEDAGFEGNARW